MKRGSILLFLIILSYSVIAACPSGQYYDVDTAGCIQQPTTDAVAEAATKGTSIPQATLTNDVSYSGVKFLANSQISVTDGKITADRVEMPDGSVVAVTDAKIENGKIVSGSFTVLSGSYQGVEDATISSTEVNMNSLIYATITPTSSSGTTTLVNARGVRSTRTSLRVVHADSISVGDATFTNVTNFTTDFVTFSLDSADVVIAETMVFNNKPFL
jgi:hypothetical protein